MPETVFFVLFCVHHMHCTVLHIVECKARIYIICIAPNDFIVVVVFIYHFLSAWCSVTHTIRVKCIGTHGSFSVNYIFLLCLA